MTSVAQLLDTAARGGPTGATALADLVARGAAVVPELIAALERPFGAIRASEVLSLIDVPDRIAMLAPLSMHASARVHEAAIEALGRTGDPRAAQVLHAAHVHDRYTRDSVIDALGNIGGPEALAELRSLVASERLDPARLDELEHRATEDRDPSELLAAAAAAQALAKLGDQSYAEAAIRLARFEAEDMELAGMVRAAAVKALDVSVAPGVASALERACDDPDAEVADAALRATLHLGRTRYVERWLRDRRPTATFCIRELVGEAPPEGGDAQTWWREREPRFDPATCYRRGQLATPAVLVGDARVRSDLRQMTGLAFIMVGVVPPPPAETAAIERWRAQHATEFAPGKLHRWGRSYAPDACDP